MRGNSTRFVGLWHITEMELWDADYLHGEVQAYIKFERQGTGEFQLGYVHGFIDYRVTKRDGKLAVEFSWDGNDECDPAIGRGWAVLEENDILKGEIFFHNGDDSGLMAERKK